MFLSTFKSPWFWLTITFLCIIIIMGSIYLHYGLLNETSITLLGSIIVGIGSFGGAILKFHGGFKQRLQDIKLFVEKSMIEAKHNADEQVNKASEDLVKRQIEYQNKSAEFLLETLIKVEQNILEEVRDTKNGITEQFEQMDDKLTKVSDDVSKLQSSVHKMEECKNKKEFWAKELEKDWDGCKTRIKMIDDKTLYSGAIVIKEEFMEFANDVLAWNLSTDSQSDKEILTNRIIEKFDAVIASTQRQLSIIINPKHNEQYIVLNKLNEHSFKLKIEKSFRENLVNNIYKNAFNYSSQYLNETLNTFVAAYLKSITPNN